MKIKPVHRPPSPKAFMHGAKRGASTVGSIKTVNNPYEHIIHTVQKGATVISGIKTAIDIGRTVVSAAQTAAPYVARIASVL